MYELTGINPKLSTEFYKAIEEAYSKENGYDLVSEAIKAVHKALAPEISESISEAMIKELIDPIKEKNNNVLTRDFENEDEAIEVYENTYNELIKESENSDNPTVTISLSPIDWGF